LLKNVLPENGVLTIGFLPGRIIQKHRLNIMPSSAASIVHNAFF